MPHSWVVMSPKHAIRVAISAAFWLSASHGLADVGPIEAAETTLSPRAEVDAPEAASPPQGISPLPDGFVPGSSYGFRVSPRTGRRTFHAGLDFLAPRGTPVRAALGGVVERITRDHRGRTRFGGYGNAVVIRHPGGHVWTFYAHLESVRVTVGQSLETGDLIGAVGNSTNHRFGGMPTHLHLEVRRARASGRSPFPGPYRRFNLDPRAWLERLGVSYGSRRGHAA